MRIWQVRSGQPLYEVCVGVCVCVCVEVQQLFRIFIFSCGFTHLDGGCALDGVHTLLSLHTLECI